jgi:hypothetical protein
MCPCLLGLVGVDLVGLCQTLRRLLPGAIHELLSTGLRPGQRGLVGRCLWWGMASGHGDMVPTPVVDTLPATAAAMPAP